MRDPRCCNLPQVLIPQSIFQLLKSLTYFVPTMSQNNQKGIVCLEEFAYVLLGTESIVLVLLCFALRNE